MKAMAVNSIGRIEPLMPERVISKESIRGELSKHLIGQTEPVDALCKMVRIYQAGLAMRGRPLGSMLLMGPTGVGKTHMVEVLAKCIHGNEKHYVHINCGEFQMEHEVAKLIGAPPGYLGHRETQPVLSQEKINSYASDNNDCTIVLLDEIEKAAPSVTRLFLGVLDKANMKLGDGRSVNFEKCFVFMTTNIGSKEITGELNKFGFVKQDKCASVATKRIRDISLAAVRRSKRFSPEFINRIDVLSCFNTLTPDGIAQILNLELERVSTHLFVTMGAEAPIVYFTNGAKDWIIKRGFSQEFGARELKRTISRSFLQPFAELVCEGDLPRHSKVVVSVKHDDLCLSVSEDMESLVG